MNKNLIAITVCFLLVIVIVVTAGYVLNTDLKHKNQSLQGKISDMQKEIDKLKEFSAGLSSLHVGIDEDIVNLADSNVLVDVKHGVKITFPTTYIVSSVDKSDRVYFGPQNTEYTCKNEVDGCATGYFGENTNGYRYYLDFVKATSSEGVLNSLNLGRDAEGQIIWDNLNGQMPKVEKNNGYEVVNYWAGGLGGSPYTTEVVGKKFNYVFQDNEGQNSSQSSTGMQASYDYMRAVIENLEYLK